MLEQRLKHTKSLLLVVALLAAITSCNRNLSHGGDGAQTSQANASDPAASPQAPEQSPCSLPTPSSFVSDFAHVLDQDSSDQLERKLQGLKDRGKIDFAVVIIKTTGGQPISDYSLALARCWEIGAQNPDRAGLLLLIAMDDRKWHIQITRSIQKVLSNDEVLDLGSLMTEPFRDGRYSEGINRCVDATIDVLAKRRHFSMSKA